MQRAIIIGSPGAGKTVFARKLRDASGLPLYYLDKIWHKPDQTNISCEEFDLKLQDILRRERWIIDGNYQRTMEMRMRECDMVFLLDVGREICLDGACSRIGRTREDLPWMESELDEEFKQEILSFGERQLPQIYELLEKYREEKTIVIFRSREETDEYINHFKIDHNT